MFTLSYSNILKSSSKLYIARHTNKYMHRALSTHFNCDILKTNRTRNKALLFSATAICLSPFCSHAQVELKSKQQPQFCSFSGIPVDSPVLLYQYDSCPYCNKAQAFMEFHGIPYKKIEVNPLNKKQIEFSSYKKVPLAKINDKQVNGSDTIISTLLGDKQSSPSEQKWVNWVDDCLIHLLPPNIYRTPSQALQAFDYITKTSGDFSNFQKFAIRYIGATVMYFVAKRSKKKYNQSDDPRQDLIDAVALWTREGLGETNAYHGGYKVDTADLAVYGVLRSIDGNYKTWEDLRNSKFENSDRFWFWFDSVKAAVKANANMV